MNTNSLRGSVFVVLGNQLFPFSEVRPYRDCSFFMAEDFELCTYVRHHKQKIALFLASMRAYRDQLAKQGCDVHYEALGTGPESDLDSSYESKLADYLESRASDRILMWEIEDKFFETRIRRFADAHRLTLEFLPSPMFLTPRPAFKTWLKENRPRMATFYRWQRRRIDVLLQADGSPTGGQWTFDSENRSPLPRLQAIPETRWAKPTRYVLDVIPLINRRFGDHPGELSAESWWLPTTRRQALDWLRSFLRDRFDLFGPYEDALSLRDPILFHSVLSPMLNLGLLTPSEVMARALKYAQDNDVRLNSLEGFVRQIIGWREFVRGVYQEFSERQTSSSFFGHERRLTDAWYDGTTGLIPLDDVIQKARRLGWAHHIERLMVVGNLMTLCEIKPPDAYRWFMEMFVDSADWVMVPNVFGMGLFADGGIFSTKPYICGSNYIRKMSDYPKPHTQSLFAETNATWCDVLDGLYWRFISRNREFFHGQARMAQTVGTLDRMKAARRDHLFAAAEGFLQQATK